MPIAGSVCCTEISQQGFWTALLLGLPAMPAYTFQNHALHGFCIDAITVTQQHSPWEPLHENMSQYAVCMSAILCIQLNLLLFMLFMLLPQMVCMFGHTGITALPILCICTNLLLLMLLMLLLLFL